MKTQQELRDALIKQGVEFVDANTVYLKEDTEIEAGVIVEPFVVFGSKVKIRKGSIIRSFSYLEGVTVGENCSVGPFARTRGECELGDEARIGNFVEVVRSTLGEKTHADHLTYIGDSTIGNNVEIGAGLITCNYNGFTKNKCVIEDNAFIGTRTTLVAPVKVAEDSLIAAGSVVTEDVEKDALAIARTPLIQKPNGASKYRTKKSS